MPKRYPEEFRRKVLDLVAAGRAVAQIATDLGISELMITAGNVRRERTTTSGRQPLDSVCADECDT